MNFNYSESLQARSSLVLDILRCKNRGRHWLVTALFFRIKLMSLMVRLQGCFVSQQTVIANRKQTICSSYSMWVQLNAHWEIHSNWADVGWILHILQNTHDELLTFYAKIFCNMHESENSYGIGLECKMDSV